jgi:hypothetical protein
MSHQSRAACGGERMLVTVRRWRVSNGAYTSRGAGIDALAGKVVASPEISARTRNTFMGVAFAITASVS